MISNREISNRFDVLYNNIMSNQAPGLDDYEKSVFFNKAQLEVLKNHLNPKGNKYGEGFDFSSKRQLEFSGLTVSKTVQPRMEWKQDAFNSKGWYVEGENLWVDSDGVQLEDQTWNSKVLSITNESLGTLDTTDYNALTAFLSTFIPDVYSDKINSIGGVTNMINWVLGLGLPEGHPMAVLLKDELEKAINGLLSHNPYDIHAVFDESPTLADSINQLGLTIHNLVVVPLNNTEYDTLLSRPYKYPPKQQSWRIVVKDTPEFILPPGKIPVSYKMRYIRTPNEVDLTTVDKTCELPDFLVDEVLQRAVELAKNAWEGNLETHKDFGERSE